MAQIATLSMHRRWWASLYILSLRVRLGLWWFWCPADCEAGTEDWLEPKVEWLTRQGFKFSFT